MSVIHNREVVDWCKSYTGEKFHAVLCDPPYEIGFMGKAFDKTGVSFRPETWAAIMDCLLPGAYLLAFGGTRTWHRLAVALEDAGFEIRDTIMWVYGSGFPKSHDVSKAIDKAAGAVREVVGERGYTSPDIRGNSSNGRGISGPGNEGRERLSVPLTSPSTPLAVTWQGYGTALKPAWEPVIVARKPLEGTVAENCVEYGAGALWIDGGRVGVSSQDIDAAKNSTKRPVAGKGYVGDFGLRRNYEPVEYHPRGRWPANFIHDGSDEVVGEFPQTKNGGQNATSIKGRGMFMDGGNDGATRFAGDEGSAARFFYCAKASKRERDAGCEGHNVHPTLKPIALTEYLAKLILPPAAYAPRRLLVPFAGSGSEMIGAHRAGWDETTGVEMDTEYCQIAEVRLKYWQSATPRKPQPETQPEDKEEKVTQATLFPM